MIKIDVNKKELEYFIDSLEKDFKKIRLASINRLWFEKFKNYFCDDKLFINKDNKLNINSKKKTVNDFKDIYSNISSNNSQFFLKIRKFIIDKFTEKIKFCPYCWKNPLIFFEKWKDKSNSYWRMFQFDHFFPKNHYHKWIINFYNLIPSCNACNHLKSDDNPLDIINNWWIIFHTYFWNLYLYNKCLEKDLWKNADINLNYFSENSKYFKLWQKYLNSQDTFNVFNFIQDKRTKIKDERTKFKKSFKSDEELKNYFFKNYYPKSEQDILKFSNWKLKKDLIENLNI